MAQTCCEMCRFSVLQFYRVQFFLVYAFDQMSFNPEWGQKWACVWLTSKANNNDTFYSKSTTSWLIDKQVDTDSQVEVFYFPLSLVGERNSLRYSLVWVDVDTSSCIYMSFPDQLEAFRDTNQSWKVQFFLKKERNCLSVFSKKQFVSFQSNYVLGNSIEQQVVCTKYFCKLQRCEKPTAKRFKKMGIAFSDTKLLYK